MLNECSNCGSIETNGVCHKCNTKDGYPINTHEEEVKKLQADNKRYKKALEKISKVNAKTKMRYAEELQEQVKQCKMLACQALQDSTTENKGE